MRLGKKMALWAFCAVPAAATMVMAGAGAASAAPTHNSPPSPGYGQRCNPWQRETWNVGGNNTVDLTYNGTNFTYAVTLHEHGSCVSGTLTDLNLPSSGNQVLAVTGDIYQNHITFSVTYPTNVQGTRTFYGNISRWGYVSGRWSETGSEGGKGTWSLQNRAHPACHGRYGWIYNTNGCRVWN